MYIDFSDVPIQEWWNAGVAIFISIRSPSSDLSSARHVGKKEKRATSLDTAPRKGGSSNRSAEGCRLGIWTRMRYEGSHVSPSPFFKEPNAPLRRFDKKFFINRDTKIRPFILLFASPPSHSPRYQFPIDGRLCVRKFSIAINDLSITKIRPKRGENSLSNRQIIIHYMKHMRKRVAIFTPYHRSIYCRVFSFAHLSSKNCNTVGYRFAYRITLRECCRSQTSVRAKILTERCRDATRPVASRRGIYLACSTTRDLDERSHHCQIRKRARKSGEFPEQCVVSIRVSVGVAMRWTLVASRARERASERASEARKRERRGKT